MEKEVLTVAALIEKLRLVDPTAPVYVGTNCCGCFKPASAVRTDDRGVVVVEDAED